MERHKNGDDGECKQEGSMTGKRAADEEFERQKPSWDGGRKEARTAAEVQEGEGLFAGPKLGGGPLWRLPEGAGASERERDRCGLWYRCGAMLEQALSCSEFADVKFVFDDGESGVSGHRGMLCSVSEEFRGMFKSGMVEAKSGEVRVRGVSRESFRGFLELLYLGEAGQEVARADGREVWVLADLYDVKGMKEWLRQPGLDKGGVGAALQYAMEGGGFLEELVEACKKFVVYTGLQRIGEESLRGVSCAATRVLLEAYLKQWPGRVVEGFEYVARWAKVNGGLVCGNGDVDSFVELIDLGKMRAQDLMEVVRPSGLVREADLLDTLRLKGVRDGKLEGKRLGSMKTFGVSLVPIGDPLPSGYQPLAPKSMFEDPRFASVAWQGEEQRLAVSSHDRVFVFDVESTECFMLVSDDFGIMRPSGVAFNHRGDIIVADQRANSIAVYDSTGDYVREIGRDGMLDGPEGVAVNAYGDIIVADGNNHRVRIFGSDGNLVLSFGSVGEENGEFMHPCGVAVGPDGMIVVADSGNSRVQVFSPFGIHVRTVGSRGEGQGHFRLPFGVAVSTHGEILVSDTERQDVQIFSRDGVFLRSIGKDDVGDGDLWTAKGEFHPKCVCVNAEGHVFVCNLAAMNVVMLG